MTFFRTFAIDRNRIWLAFTESEAAADLVELIQREQVGKGGLEGFRSLDDSIVACIPASVYFDQRERLDPLVESFAARVAAKYSSTAFSRFHSALATEWIEREANLVLPKPGFDTSSQQAKRLGEVAELVQEFVRSFVSTPQGRAHFDSYRRSRETAQRNIDAIRAAANAGEDITELVLLGVLPHADTEKNRQRGAWISIASAIAGDVRQKLTQHPRDWTAVASEIIQFIQAALDDPSDIAQECETFAASPLSLGFQGGMLTPFLNAIDPSNFSILNRKSRLVTNYINGTRFGQSIAEYPLANVAIQSAASDIAGLVDEDVLSEIPESDFYDAFCHWMVAIRRFFKDADDEEPVFSSRAFELLSLLDAEPVVATYDAHKAEFRSSIEQPFRRLFEAIIPHLTPEMRSALETEKNVFSRFRKNDWGKGGAWPFYWGAFYPKGSDRVRGLQLFVYASSRWVTYGFYAGDAESEEAKRAVSYLRDSGRVISDGFDHVLNGYAFGELSRVDSKTMFDTLDTCLADGSDQDLLDIRRVLTAEEAGERSLKELATEIAQSFRELFPLMKVAMGVGQIEAENGQPIPGPLPSSADWAREESNVSPVYSLEAFAEETGFPVATIEMWARAIERKKQAVLYGPPGTGKTFIAERLARHLAGGSDGFIEILQFHPAYSYEDFMEGIRPVSSGGALSYPVVPGRFRSFCDRARVRHGRCLLIIDEINRANLARVLGELMYLLEYRERSVPLASGTDFSIPANVRIIGTMNTADRSIALVDHALRRRFAFLPLRPDYGVLRSFHRGSNLSERLIGLIQEVNADIEPHYQVGISFFLEKRLEDHLPDIWRTEIEPYLEEYFFDRPEKWRAAQWSHIAQRLLGTTASDPGPAESVSVPLDEDA